MVLLGTSFLAHLDFILLGLVLEFVGDFATVSLFVSYFFLFVSISIYFSLSGMHFGAGGATGTHTHRHTHTHTHP